MSAMALIMTTCPATNAPVSTSQHVAPHAFAQTPFPNAAFRCPACGQVHRWLKEDAWVVDPPSRWTKVPATS